MALPAAKTVIMSKISQLSRSPRMMLQSLVHRICHRQRILTTLSIGPNGRQVCRKYPPCMRKLDLTQVTERYQPGHDLVSCNDDQFRWSRHHSSICDLCRDVWCIRPGYQLLHLHPCKKPRPLLRSTPDQWQQILFTGLAPFLLLPLSSRFGRRPVWLVCTLCTAVCNIGCAKSNTYAAMLICRILGSLFISAPIALGPPVVVEMYPEHERGYKLGIWTYVLSFQTSYGLS